VHSTLVHFLFLCSVNKVSFDIDIAISTQYNGRNIELGWINPCFFEKKISNPISLASFSLSDTPYFFIH